MWILIPIYAFAAYAVFVGLATMREYPAAGGVHEPNDYGEKHRTS